MNNNSPIEQDKAQSLFTNLYMILEHITFESWGTGLIDDVVFFLGSQTKSHDSTFARRISLCSFVEQKLFSFRVFHRSKNCCTDDRKNNLEKKVDIIVT